MEYSKTVKIDVSCTTPKQIIREKQLDNGTRTIYATFYNAVTNTDITFDGSETFEFRIRRADGALVTANAEYESPSIVVTLTSEMLGCAGRAQADIRAMKDDEILSGGSFAIDVESVANGSESKGTSGDVTNTRMLTEAEYEALETKSTNTVYLVRNDDTGLIMLYLGEQPIASIAGGADTYLNGHELIVYETPETDPEHHTNRAKSYVSADENGNLKLAKSHTPRYSDPTESYIVIGDDVITAYAGENELTLSADGLLLNGKKVGGSQPIGQLVGILSGVTDSVIGTLEEVTE